MQTCTKLEHVESAVMEIVGKVAINKDTEKYTRVDIWDISANDVKKMLDNYDVDAFSDSDKHISKKIKRALELSFVKAYRHKEFVDSILGKLFEGNATSGRHQAMALKQVLDTIEGEMNKAVNYDVKLNDIQNADGIPRIPLHRLAASIGRQVLYTQGYRIQKGNIPGNSNAADVEQMYYNAGLNVLNQLQKNGFVKLHEKHTGNHTIRDYTDHNGNPISYKEPTTDAVASVELNAKALGAKESGVKSNDETLIQIRGRAGETTPVNKYKSQFASLQAALKAVDLLSVPQTIVFPAGHPDQVSQYHLDDYLPAGTAEQVKRELESKPTMLNGSLRNFFALIHEELKDSSEPASEWLLRNLSSKVQAERMFKIDQSRASASDRASVSGRNLASTVPIDDLVEYYDGLNDEMYMAMFAGRNTRMYMDNTLVNPHSSKFMRHALSVKEYEIETKNPAFNFFVDKITTRLKHHAGASESDIKTAIMDLHNKGKSPLKSDLQKALDALAAFNDADTAVDKLAHANTMYLYFEGSDLADTITTLQGVQDIVDANKSGTLVSNVMVSSDATASGGLLTLMQALGSVPGVEDLLKRMGVLNGKSKKSPVSDIYAILQEKIDEFITDSDDTVAIIKGVRATEDNISQLGFKSNVRDVLQAITDVLFDGDKRDLSKNPTMTFIYDQQETGAKTTLAKEFTKRFLEKYKIEKNRPALDELLVALGMQSDGLAHKVTNDTEFKTELNNSFKESTVPDILYEFLTDAITTPYLKDYKDQAEAIFELVTELGNNKMKVFPAPLVLDLANGNVKPEDLEHSEDGNPYTKRNLDKYGVPLSKVIEHEQLMDGDVSVLTRIEQLRSTVMNVSTIHSADTANLLHGLKGLAEEFDSGVVVVHDDIRSRPDLVMKAEKQYIATNEQVGKFYSVHNEVLKALKAYDVENKVTSKVKYTKLVEKVGKQQSTKMGILDNAYNHETTAVIGDKSITDSGNQSTEQQDVQQKVDTAKQDKNVVKHSANENDNSVVTKNNEKVADEFLTKAAESSAIVKGFLAMANRAKVVAGSISSFNTSNDTLTINTNSKALVQELEHEITHSYTAALVQDYFNNGRKNQDLAYIEKAIRKLAHVELTATDISTKTQQRINHIIYRDSFEVGMAEFISVMMSEPEVAAEIYALVDSNGNTLVNIVKKVLKRINTVIRRASEKDNLHDNVDAEQLYSSINAIFRDGKSMRELEFDVFSELQEAFNKQLFFGPNKDGSYVGRTPNGVMENIYYGIDKVNAGVAEYSVKVAEEQSIRLGKHIHNYLKVKVPSYMRVVARAQGYYNDSKNLQQLMHKITNSGINQIKKNEILSLFQEISADKDVVTSKELERFKQASKGVSDVDMQAFEDFSSKMSLMDYFVGYPNGISNLDNEIETLSKKFNATQLRQLDMLVNFNVNDELTKNTPYNLFAAGLAKGGEIDSARKLLVAKSIKEIGPNRFRDLLKNQELMDVTRDNLLANNALLAKHVTVDTSQLRDSSLADYYEEPVNFKAISFEELKNYDTNKDWKILRQPTKDSPGVVYQKVIDGTFQSDVFTNLQFQSTDIEDNAKRFKGMKGVAVVEGKQKIVLTRTEKIKAGLITNPAQSIVRTMAHNMAIQDSEVIREKLLEHDTTYDLKKEGAIELLVKQIKANETEGTAWFLNDIEDRDFNTLPKDIKNKYMRIPTSVSSVNGFDQKVKYVRKDISYWLTGTAEQSIARNRTVQVGIRVLKGIIGGTKIGMVILNPVKIAKDNVFNFVYLSVLGVGPLEAAKYYKDIAAEFNEYQELKDRAQSLMVRSYAEPEGKYTSQLTTLNNRIARHPMNGVVKRGFINSLGSEIIMQEDSPGSGFKHDIDKALKTILQDNKGKNNKIGQLIMKVANTPQISMEGFLEVLSKPFRHLNSTKHMEAELVKMSERFENIKSNDDVVAYMHQYMNSPDSEFVKLGTHMTDLTDVLAKESYYRHLVEKLGMDTDKAEKEVLKVFPDYKEGLPTAVQKLDSVGIVMYPQYWLQMIRAMYRLTEKRPASFGSEVMLSQLMGTQSQLWSQTIFDKAFSNWGLVHNPTNHIGVGSIIPTNVF